MKIDQATKRKMIVTQVFDTATSNVKFKYQVAIEQEVTFATMYEFLKPNEGQNTIINQAYCKSLYVFGETDIKLVVEDIWRTTIAPEYIIFNTFRGMVWLDQRLFKQSKRTSTKVYYDIEE